MSLPTGRAMLDPDKILQEAKLSKGETFADFGCGALGHFVIPATAIVGEKGWVFALDILKDILEAVDNRAKAEKILNLQTVWGDLEHEKGVLHIPENSVDLVSLINITGLLFKSEQVINNIKKVLKDHGRLLLVDWKDGSILANYMTTHKTAQFKLKGLLEKNGFFLIKSFTAGNNHFGLLFKK